MSDILFERLSVYGSYKEEILYFFDLFKQNAYECYLIGGCVRNLLMGIKPCDYEFVTDALPDEILYLLTGRNFIIMKSEMCFGTIAIKLENKHYYKFNTYRGKYINYKKRNDRYKVAFVKTLYEDVMNRDFTVNALAYSLDDGIIDYVGGIEDLQLNKLCFIGNMLDSLHIDYRRAIRAIRFWYYYDFEMSDEDLECCREFFIKYYNRMEQDRVRSDILRMLQKKVTSKEKLEFMLNLLKETCMPELKGLVYITNSDTNMTLWDETLNVLMNCSKYKDMCLMTAALYHLTGFTSSEASGNESDEWYAYESKELASDLLCKMRFSDVMSSDIMFLVEYQYYFECDQDNWEEKMRDLYNGQQKKERILQLLKLIRSCKKARMQDTDSVVDINRGYRRLKHLYARCVVNDIGLTLDDLDLSASDIDELGLRDLEDNDIVIHILYSCIQNPDYNNRDWIIEHFNKFCE